MGHRGRPLKNKVLVKGTASQPVSGGVSVLSDEGMVAKGDSQGCRWFWYPGLHGSDRAAKEWCALWELCKALADTMASTGGCQAGPDTNGETGLLSSGKEMNTDARQSCG